MFVLALKNVESLTPQEARCVEDLLADLPSELPRWHPDAPLAVFHVGDGAGTRRIVSQALDRNVIGREVTPVGWLGSLATGSADPNAPIPETIEAAYRLSVSGEGPDRSAPATHIEFPESSVS